MDSKELLALYRELQQYVAWSNDDAVRVQQAAHLLKPRLHEIIDDFYAQMLKHPKAAAVVTGGASQVQHLKTTLRTWLEELLSGTYDVTYVTRRWQVGRRHVEIGLRQVYTHAAMTRLRNGMIRVLSNDTKWCGQEDLSRTVESLNKLLDIDLAIIGDAYESEHLRRSLAVERERSEDKFRKLVEAAACAVIILRQDGRIAYFSPYAEKLTGYAATDVVGRDYLAEFLPEDYRAAVEGEIHEIITGNPCQGHEAPIVLSDGSLRWMLWNAQRINDYEGGPAALAVGHDITERRQAQERLLRSERLAGIGQMIAGLAHESRNALQRIQSCAEMLELEVDDGSEAAVLVKRLQQAQDDLAMLFQEVREFAAPIRLERDECELSAVWHQAWSLLETKRCERQIEFNEPTNGQPLTMFVDRFRLVQLFRNLFENSLAACADPVRIDILCRTIQLDKCSAVEISVRDNGPGLSKDVKQKVFEPFFTTKTKGTGLGMAIARQIVEAHEGEISAGNAACGGAEFVITLPRVSP